MKILIITGLLAKETIIQNIKTYKKHEIYLKSINTPIAAFITNNMIINTLKKEETLYSINTNKTTNINYIDLILTPGLTRQDTKKIKNTIKKQTYKGPSNAADIKITLDIIEKTELSTTKPADKYIIEQQEKQALKTITEYEEDNKPLQKPNNTLIGNCKIGSDYPMRILSEIPNAPQLNEKELHNKIQHYINSGADMIDIGMYAGENHPKEAYSLIKTVKENYDIPVSIDTLNPEEIKEAIKAEVDLVLSLDHGNYKKTLPLLEDTQTSAVILPTNYKKGIIPQTPKEKIISLEKLENKCKNITVIADPILDPINSNSTTESIITCFNYKKRNPNTLLFFGVGNVTELLDSDSNGVNAVLSGIGMEIGVNILFTPEASKKTYNSVKELKTASNMMFLSKIKNTIPKNLGLNLITLKDSFNKEDIHIDTSNISHITAKSDGFFLPDRKGSFKIIVEDNKIKAIQYNKFTPILVIESKTARAMYEELIRRNLVSRLEHAAYLGMELEKAEIALKLGKKYMQDFEIF
ncbi:MAG: dihydropteroate synthase-like protein [Methanobacteriaceae archaeon]|nr:dihydropteroate synthase-like protein [Methanobacteriaceae archaeon]